MKGDRDEGTNVWKRQGLFRQLTGKVSELLKEPIFISAFNLMTNGGITAVLGFLFIMVTTRMFPPSEVGLYSAIISAAGLLALFSRFGFDIGLIRFLPSSRTPMPSSAHASPQPCFGSMASPSFSWQAADMGSVPGNFIIEDPALMVMFIGDHRHYGGPVHPA